MTRGQTFYAKTENALFLTTQWTCHSESTKRARVLEPTRHVKHSVDLEVSTPPVGIANRAVPNRGNLARWSLMLGREKC